jgi:hypothetical protein
MVFGNSGLIYIVIIMMNCLDFLSFCIFQICLFIIELPKLKRPSNSLRWQSFFYLLRGRILFIFSSIGKICLLRNGHIYFVFLCIPLDSVLARFTYNGATFGVTFTIGRM